MEPNNDTTPAPIGPAKQSHDALKAVMLVVLFFATLLASTASLPFRQFVRARAATSPLMVSMFSAASCLGAGVFLGTCLLDMLPDALHSWARAERRHLRALWGDLVVGDGGPPTNFVPCALFIGFGFLLVLLLEQVAQCALRRLGRRATTTTVAAAGDGGPSLFQMPVDGVQHHHQQHRHHEDYGSGGGGRRDSQREHLLTSSASTEEDHRQLQQQQHPQADNNNSKNKNDNNTSKSGACDGEHDVTDQHAQSSSSSVVHHQQQQQGGDDDEQRRPNGAAENSGGGGGCTASGGCANGFDLSTLRALLLVFALSFHACFEGVSIGTFTDVSALVQIFVALLIHKSIVGFSLGIRLVQSHLSAPVVVLCCLLFAVQVLIGGFISLAIMDLLTGRGAAVYILAALAQAFACGTFLYITTMEILPHEFSHASVEGYQNQLGPPANTDDFAAIFEYLIRLQKSICLCIGFGLIILFVAIFPDVEDSGNGR